MIILYSVQILALAELGMEILAPILQGVNKNG